MHFISHVRYCVMCKLVFWGFPNDLLISCCYYYTAHRLQPHWCHHLSHLSCEIVLIAAVAALHFFPSLLLAWTGLGVLLPWLSTLTYMHLQCYCYAVFWVFFNAVFIYSFLSFFFFFRILWSITFPCLECGQEFGILLSQVPFWIKMHVSFLEVDKRRAIPERFYCILLCYLGRYVVIMSFSSSTFTSPLGWQIH